MTNVIAIVTHFDVDGGVVIPSPQTTMASTDAPRDGTVKPPGAGRLPPLDRLAARMGLNAQPKDLSGGPGATARPRLAANALRTGSTTSLATTASTTDSMAVNVPNTRSVSPSAISTSPPQSGAQTPTESNGDALTSERLEKHNQETSTVPEKKQVKVGFKNIPSLDAITARMVKTRQLSVDGTAKPPEPLMIEDPKTPGLHMKAPEHPLQFPWYVFQLGAIGRKC
jgi:translation initiation factor 4E